MKKKQLFKIFIVLLLIGLFFLFKENNEIKTQIYKSNQNEINYYTKQIKLLNKKNYLDKNALTYQTDDGNIFLNLHGEHKKITSEEDGQEYMLPELSPNHTYLTYESMRGVTVLNISDNIRKKLGGASGVNWHPSKDIFLFLRTKDDGSNLTEATIYLYDIKNNKELKLKDTTNYIPDDAIFSKDGNYIYFTDIKDEDKIITINIQDIL